MLQFYFYLDRLGSTEYVLPSGESVQGPDLPEHLHGHTISNYNSTHSFLIGGWSKEFGVTGKTWFISHIDETFKEGPTLNVARYFHTTGT